MRVHHRAACRLLQLVFLLGLLGAPCAWAGTGECIMCGMKLGHYCHVRYQVVDSNGTVYTTCGVQCGLLLQLNLKERFRRATATDLFSHQPVAADRAWYVYRSSVVTDMAPGFIAFADRRQAERFAGAYGGQLLDFRQALETVRKGFR